MKREDLILKGGDSINYPTAIFVSLSGAKTKFKNEYTDGKFVSQEEFYKIIRKDKLKKISENYE
jgi:hypothetical protein